MPSNDANSGGDRGVLGSLPHARPQRRSAKREKASAQTAAQAKAAAASAPRATPRPEAIPRAKAAEKPPAPRIPPAGYATPDDDVPRGVGLVTTAVQAAGELAVIGAAAGGRAVKSVIRRLPRP